MSAITPTIPNDIPSNQVTSDKKGKRSNCLHFFKDFFVVNIASVITLESLDFLATRFKLIPQDPCWYWNSWFGMMTKGNMRIPPQLIVWKKFFAPECIKAGFIEELEFRGILQDLLLKRLLGRVIKKISPSNASWVNTKAAKVFRVALISAIFGVLHLSTPTGEIPPAIQYQAFNAVITGLIFGSIKESRLGLLGSIMNHMALNAIVVAQIYVNCIRSR